jgi:hypothetical protein
MSHTAVRIGWEFQRRSTQKRPEGAQLKADAGSGLNSRRNAGAMAVIRLPIALACTLLALVLLDAVCELTGAGQLWAIQRQVDITNTGNLSSVFAAGVFSLTGLCAFAIAILSRTGAVRGGWIFVTTGFLGLAAFELLQLRASIRYVPILVLAASVLLFAFLFRQLWGVPAARWLLTLALILFLSNPVSEYGKVHVTGNPDNYVFVSNDQPFRFEEDAWIRLSILAHIQEATEIGGTICLLAAFLVRRESLRAGTRCPASRSALVHHPAIQPDQT